jgi:PAS domain S-box-containing protein
MTMRCDAPASRSIPEWARSDAARIDSEILNAGLGTDPFVAAVRATRMPMVISNPRLPDNPVVFVNDAFCRLTGYSRSEVVGRNCRFLQGPQTDRAAVAKIRAALAAQQPLEIDIRNHRKNGEPFWNRLLMAPVPDDHGALAYFFASQVDVTIERERLAGLESHNAALMAEVAGRLRAQQDSEARLRFATASGNSICAAGKSRRRLPASCILAAIPKIPFPKRICRRRSTRTTAWASPIPFGAPSPTMPISISNAA